MYNPYLAACGMEAQYEQYGLYASTIGTATYSFYRAGWAYNQVFYLRKLIRETDHDMRTIWAAKGRLQPYEVAASKNYLAILEKEPIRWASLPVGVAIVGGALLLARYVWGKEQRRR